MFIWEKMVVAGKIPLEKNEKKNNKDFVINFFCVNSVWNGLYKAMGSYK